jgi:hypothetical protein
MGGSGSSRSGSTILANRGNDGGGIHIWIRSEPGYLILSEIRNIFVAPPFNNSSGLGRGLVMLRRHDNGEMNKLPSLLDLLPLPSLLGYWCGFASRVGIFIVHGS